MGLGALGRVGLMVAFGACARPAAPPPPPQVPYLGAVFFDEAPQIFGAGAGAVIWYVAPGSPAAAAGIRSLDVLVRLGGVRIARPIDVRPLLEWDAGCLAVQVLRDGELVHLGCLAVVRRSGVDESSMLDAAALAVPIVRVKGGGPTFGDRVYLRSELHRALGMIRGGRGCLRVVRPVSRDEVCFDLERLPAIPASEVELEILEREVVQPHCYAKTEELSALAVRSVLPEKAVFELPDGGLFSVSHGDLVGRQCGRVLIAAGGCVLVSQPEGAPVRLCPH